MMSDDEKVPRACLQNCGLRGVVLFMKVSETAVMRRSTSAEMATDCILYIVRDCKLFLIFFNQPSLFIVQFFREKCDPKCVNLKVK